MHPAKFLLGILIFFMLVFMFHRHNVAYSQTQPFTPPAISAMPGPVMFCGDIKELDKILINFKELEFMVLSNMQQGETGVHYIFYRNANTGTWSLVAYNMKNAPSNIACLVAGGFKAFILPNNKELNGMIKKQKDGFNKIKGLDPEA